MQIVPAAQLFFGGFRKQTVCQFIEANYYICSNHFDFQLVYQETSRSHYCFLLLLFLNIRNFEIQREMNRDGLNVVEELVESKIVALVNLNIFKMIC